MKGQKKWLLMLSLLLLGSPARAAQDASAGLDEVFLQATSLIGTPYHLGGSTPETGMDCSGFVRYVYLQAAQTDLPRTAADMSRHGEAIGAPDLRPGDLVFFNTLNRPYSHVGIYLGENRFIHASSSAVGSVTISSLQDPYWSAHYDGARRILAALADSSSP